MRTQKIVKLIMGLAAISFLNVACQGNLQTGAFTKASEVGDSTPLSTPEDIQSRVNMKAIQDSVDASAQSMQEARQVLAQFSNPDGSIKIWSLMFSSSSSTDVESQSIFIIYEKLSQVLNKIADKVALAKGKLTEARVRLAEEAAKLDATLPQHQMVLQQISLMMAQIDSAESQFSMGLNQLAGQLDLVNRGIDMLTASAGGLFPGAGIIVSILTNQVKMAITDFQTKLRTL